MESEKNCLVFAYHRLHFTRPVLTRTYSSANLRRVMLRYLRQVRPTEKNNRISLKSTDLIHWILHYIPHATSMLTASGNHTALQSYNPRPSAAGVEPSTATIRKRNHEDQHTARTRLAEMLSHIRFDYFVILVCSAASRVLGYARNKSRQEESGIES